MMAMTNENTELKKQLEEKTKPTAEAVVQTTEVIPKTKMEILFNPDNSSVMIDRTLNSEDDVTIQKVEDSYSLVTLESTDQ